MIRCKIQQDNFWDNLKIFFFDVRDTETVFFSLDQDGTIKTNTYTIMQSDVDVKPFIEMNPKGFSHQASRGILQALAEGLKDFGIVAEVDNKQRIVAEALAQERKEQNDYLKKQSETLVNKILEKI